VSEDGPQRPGNGNARGEVTLRRREGVAGGGTLEEEEGKEDEDLGPDARMVVERVDAERLKASKDDQDGGPAVVEREGQVHEELVANGARLVVLLHGVVDGRHSAIHEVSDGCG
jgi:hypothetical protein